MVEALTISVDIGNTNTHIALVDSTTKSCIAVNVISTKEIGFHFLSSINTLYPNYKKLPFIISSVVQSVNASITKILEKENISPTWFTWNENFPISIHYYDKTILGKDRLANCLYGYYTYPNKNQILLDTGTALKIDFLKNGNEFMGGTIIPGIATQLKSLHDNTNALPLLSAQTIPMEFPGTSTEACMQSGILLGAVGSIAYIIEKYKKLYGEDCIILATGGAWKYIEHLIQFEYQYVPHLTLIGTALYQNIL